MTKRLFTAVMASLFILAGCATPQQPVALSKTVLQHQGNRIGVAMVAPAKADTTFPGADCLLCLAAASVANTSLTKHTQTLPTDDLLRLKSEVADALRKKGQAVTVIDTPIVLGDLPTLSAAPNKSRIDFSSLRKKHNIDRLLIVEIYSLGMTRPYAAYIPTGDPQGYVAGVGYLVNLSDNSYEWYLPLRHVKSAAGKWDEAPSFPGLTNAYFQAVEGTRDAVLQPLSE